MVRAFAITVVLVLSSLAHGMSFVDAIAQQESGNRPLAAHYDVNTYRLGYFQISKDVWTDATAFDKSLRNGSWEQCEKDRDYGAKVMLAYLRRYCPDAVKNNDYETMARVWNGGPKGASKKATVGYWNDVKARLER